MIVSCAHKNSEKETLQYADQLVHDVFPHEGKYVWSFDLMSSEQVSTHIFYSDSIVYSMTGKVYATDYTMKKLSYDKTDDKWIGQDQEGIVYTMFFKDKTDNTIKIYKHKCKDDGLAEALAFNKPSADTTGDHGWNVYSLNGHDTPDVLPLSGTYRNNNNNLIISDKIMVIDGKKAEKISYHIGERRWVGSHDDGYVQIFFKRMEDTDNIELSIAWSKNPQDLYSTKYESIESWSNYVK